MSYSNETSNLKLPQYTESPNDCPSWLTDINNAFSTIDTAITENKSAIENNKNNIQTNFETAEYLNATLAATNSNLLTQSEKLAEVENTTALHTTHLNEIDGRLETANTTINSNEEDIALLQEDNSKNIQDLLNLTVRVTDLESKPEQIVPFFINAFVKNDDNTYSLSEEVKEYLSITAGRPTSSLIILNNGYTGGTQIVELNKDTESVVKSTYAYFLFIEISNNTITAYTNKNIRLTGSITNNILPTTLTVNTSGESIITNNGIQNIETDTIKYGGSITMTSLYASNPILYKSIIK